MNKKQIMKRAWELAKEGVRKFGGKAREYFAIALSIAWKEFKTMTVKLIGSEKQIKWANDIIAHIEAAKPKMKEVAQQCGFDKHPKAEEIMNEALNFIDSLTNFPLFKNKASLYIQVCGFVKTEKDAYDLLDKLFYYDDITAMVSKHAKAILKRTHYELVK